MPKYYRKRRPMRRKRRRNFFKKGAKRSNTGYLSVKHKVATGVYTVPAQTWPDTTGTGQPVNTSIFQIVDLPNLGSYSKLFDQFRLTGVNVKFSNVSNPMATQNDGYNFITSTDLDGNVIGSIGEMLQCTNTKRVRVKEGSTIINRFIRPRIRNVIEGAAPPTNSTAFQIGSTRWCDLASPAIPFYGLNWAPTGVPGEVLNNDSNWNIDITYYVQFRKLR